MFKPRVFGVIRDVSLRSKLVFVFFVISIIPILALGLGSYNISSSIVEQKAVSENLNRLELIRNRVDQVFKEKQFTGIKFSMDDKVLFLLGNESMLGEDEKRKYEFEVKKLLYDYSNINGTLNISIISKNNIKYTNDKFADSMKVPNEWVKHGDFLHSKKTYEWLDIENMNDNYVVPLLRKIVNPDLETVGLLILNLKEDLLANAYRDFELNNSVSYYVINERGSIISSLNKSMLGKNVYESFNVTKGELNKNGYHTRKLNRNQYLIIYLTDEVSGLKYISLMPVKEMLSSTGYIKSLTFLICMICLIICFITSLIISNSLTRPIRKLINSIENFQGGDMNVNLEINRNDEIGKLGQNYNSMLKQLKVLIDDFYKEQRKKREAEIKALEFQINPHFLYNTLSSVIWLCEENDNKSAIKITKALANFFRISISKGKEMIRISDELSHAGYYIQIQKMRYSSNFDAVFDIDPVINDFYTPKIILQPLVENAIYHGIKSLNGEEGKIVIKGMLVDGDIIFEVLDNGIKMDEQQVEKINRFLRKETGCEVQDENFGIGISNVNDRIMLYFGPGYGLSYRRENNYTVAVVRVKAAKEEMINV